MVQILRKSRYILVFSLLLSQARSETTGSDNIRLVGGTAFAGRVEVFVNGVWGTVCDDSWDIKDATVACCELGYPGDAVASYGVAAFGEGTGSIHLDDLECTGSENSLQDCIRAESHNCFHSEDAAVMCQNPSMEIKPDLLNTGSCGRRPVLTRIVNGQDADVGEWPWIAYLIVESLGFYYMCGAVLINNGWAITAAHCQNAASGYIVLGDISRSSETATHQQSDVTMYCHPNYDEEIFDNDSCLLKLHTPVNYNDNVQPLCLSVSKQELNTYPAGSCYVIGWGALGYGENTADHLQELATSLITNSECNEPYGHITDNMICTRTGSISGACQGDSGGPLMCNDGNDEWHMVVVTSHGIECASGLYPDVLARVSRYSQWIRQTVDISDFLQSEARICYSCSYVEVDGQYDHTDGTSSYCKDSPHLTNDALCQENCVTIDYTYTFIGLFGITSTFRLIVRGCSDSLHPDVPSPGRCFTGSRFDSWYVMNWDDDAEDLSFFDFDDLTGSVCTCANEVTFCEGDYDGGYSTKVLSSGLVILLCLFVSLFVCS